MTPFLQGYVHAALWTTDPSPPCGDYAGRAAELESKVDPSWLAEAERDCLRFQEENGPLLAQAGSDDENGHDFWLTRNGHGAGFRDRDYAPEVAGGLSDACDKFGESYLDWPLPDVTEQRDLALALLDWHSGQASALYAVGSCMLADAERDEVYRPEAHGHEELIGEAIQQLKCNSCALAERLRTFLAAREGAR